MPQGAIASVYLDGVEVTDAVEGSVTHALNGIGQASIKVPMTSANLPTPDAFGCMAGSYLKVYLDTGSGPVLWHHGRNLMVETAADKDGGYVVFNSSDPLELWSRRPVRNPPGFPLYDPDPGNFSQPTILTDFLFGPQIVEAMMDGSELNTIPADSEGPLRLAKGSFAGGTVDLSGVPADWPMTMMQLAALMVGTGVLDIVITPIEFDGDNNYGQIDCYNGDYGTDRTGSVTFSYGMGARNIQSLRWTEDMTTMDNKLWYFLGPRIDPEHWQANVTGDAPLPDPPKTTVIARRDASRALYDVRMDISIYDSVGEDAVMPKELYYRRWLLEQYLRAIPRTLVHITPTPDTAIGTFDIGDLVTVEGATAVRGGFSGGQRVYALTVSWNAENSTPALGEIQTSADQEGFIS